MNNETAPSTGAHRIVEFYREMFRIPENTKYYSSEDYKNAERQFLKYALSNGLSVEPPYQN